MPFLLFQRFIFFYLIGVYSELLEADALIVRLTNSPDVSVFSCLDDPHRRWTTREFGWQGRCLDLSDRSGCAYYDLRALNLAENTGLDQRGIIAYQMTYPRKAHLFAALSIEEEADEVVCWSGGAIVGKNPLAMPWSTDSGGKVRKNNFLQSESGIVRVEGVRIHNTHDAFLAKSPAAGFDIRKSWLSWNRDDFFEGQLHRLSITDSLIDGTYNFLSDPDDGCIDASDKTVVIRDSLIRLQEQPGPYGGHTSKWHWQVEGGHNLLYKLDSCRWDQWPSFELVNNIFLIEGPYTTKTTLNRAKCNLALPGPCDDKFLPKLSVCQNNIFLYEQYKEWRQSNTLPGPSPRPGYRFHNKFNPDFLVNHHDCYQRVTDDPSDVGYGDVRGIWNARKSAWINIHSDKHSNPAKVMQLPGVDFPVLNPFAQIRLRNAFSGDCLASGSDGSVKLSECSEGSEQWFSTRNLSNGYLDAGLIFETSSARILHTRSDRLLQRDQSDKHLNLEVISTPIGNVDDIDERWYVLPSVTRSEDDLQLYVIESDGLRRTYLRDNAGIAEFQPLYEAGTDTVIPEKVNEAKNYDASLQWHIDTR